MDVIDSANDRAARDLDRAISAARRTNGLHYGAIGHCLNCGPEVPLPPGKRWCDPDCRDDFLRREGRP